MSDYLNRQISKRQKVNIITEHKAKPFLYFFPSRLLDEHVLFLSGHPFKVPLAQNHALTRSKNVSI